MLLEVRGNFPCINRMKEKEEFENVNDGYAQMTITIKKWQKDRIRKIAENNKPIPVTMNMAIRYIISDWFSSSEGRFKVF